MGISCSKVPSNPVIMARALTPGPKTGGYVKILFSFKKLNLPRCWLDACWKSLNEIMDKYGGRLSNLDRSFTCHTLIPPESHIFVGVSRLILPAQQDKPEIKLEWY